MYQSSHHDHDSCLSLPSDHYHNLHAFFQPSSSHQHGSIDLQKEQLYSSIPGPPFSLLESGSRSMSLYQIGGQQQQQQQSHDYHGTLGQHQLAHLGFDSAVGVGSMRRVLSTEDIRAFSEHVPPETMQQHRPPADSGDNSSQELGSGAVAVAVASAAAGRVGRYGPEERRERIERYRNKRNQRNFHKKVTYACRKTLADRRPRVHGRFARNEEAETEATDVNSVGAMPCSDWRFQAEAAAAAAAEEEDSYYCYDAQLWNNFADAFSINNLV